MKRRTILQAAIAGLAGLSGGTAAAIPNPNNDTRLEFQIYRASDREWRWRLVAGNGQTIATAAQGYSSKAACLHGISLVRKAWAAPVKMIDEGR